MNVEVNEKSPLFLPNLFTGGLAGLTIGTVQKIAIAAQGAASIATVASQKFAKGGILNGPSHAQGGIKTNLGELEGGEAVINKKSTAMFGGTLSAINEAGGGKKFARGGVLPTPNTITTPNDINKDILKALTNFNLSPTVSVVEINEAQTRISEIHIDLETVEKLFKEGIIDPRGLRVFLVRNDFKVMKEQNPELTNYAITKELVYKYNLGESTIYKWVTNYG
jgi:hypothetical protein